MQANYLKVAPDESVFKTIELLKREQRTEAYCVEEDGTYLGKLFLPQLLEMRSRAKVGASVIASETVIPANSTLLQAIEIASDFIGRPLQGRPKAAKLLAL